MIMNLFEIENLKCSYNGGNPVLEIKNLSISQGKLVVIIGLSGAGKSTLLETLGLMNNTINNNSSIKFLPSKNESYDFSDIWDAKNDNSIFDVRRKHFSFIFQSTNLMPNFTVYENICLTQMFQGKSTEESMENAEHWMGKLGLQEVDKHKKSYEISGGQAQRVAFVRAITPEFTVLFGDEPTGNLDERNSWDLMRILKERVVEGNKTAIIVTHNIKLALAFADQIVMITKLNQHGTIESENVFLKDDKSGNWISETKEFDKPLMNSFLVDALEMN